MVSFISYLESGDYSHLKSNTGVITTGENAISKINKSFVSNYGVSKDAIKIQDKLVKIELLELKMIRTGDLSISSIIALEYAEYNNLFVKENKVDYYKVWVDIECSLGFRLSNDLTVFQFYTYMNKVKSDYERAEKLNDEMKKKVGKK